MPIKMTIIIFKIYRPKRLKKQGRRHEEIGDSNRYWRMESWWIGRIEETEHNFFRTRRKNQAAKAQELGFTERKYEAQIWNSESRLKVCTRGLVTSSYKSSDMRLIPCRTWIKKVLSLRREKFQKSSRGAEGPKIGGLSGSIYIYGRNTPAPFTSPLSPSRSSNTCSQAQGLRVFLCRNWVTPENTPQIQSHCQACKSQTNIQIIKYG